MNPSPTFDRVHNEIRQRVMAGAWLPGQRIDLPHLASELGASMTPVRDALNRLIGERLLTTGTNDGFAMPGMTEPDLRDMYDWLHQLLLLATRQRTDRSPALAEQADDDQEISSFPALFAAIADHCDNIELRAAIIAVEARLAPAHGAEHRLLMIEDELIGLRRAVAGGSPAVVRSRLAMWHRRRVQAAGRIVQLLHRPDRPRMPDE
jgi:hypothetical protein